MTRAGLIKPRSFLDSIAVRADRRSVVYALGEQCACSVPLVAGKQP